MLNKVLSATIIILTIIIIFGLSRQIINALQISSRLDRSTDTLSILQEENRSLKKRLERVNTVDFIEEEARNKLNLAKEGEEVVIIPQEEIEELVQSYRPHEPLKEPNWLKWIKLFL